MECRVQRSLTKDQLFKKFSEKRKKISDMLKLYCEKKKKEHQNGHAETDE